MKLNEDNRFYRRVVAFNVPAGADCTDTSTTDPRRAVVECRRAGVVEVGPQPHSRSCWGGHIATVSGWPWSLPAIIQTISRTNVHIWLVEQECVAGRNFRLSILLLLLSGLLLIHSSLDIRLTWPQLIV